MRESKKELGDSEVVLIRSICAALSFSGQLFQSAELEKSPLSFPISRLPLPQTLPLLSQRSPIPRSIGVPRFDLVVRRGSHWLGGFLLRIPNITCFYVVGRVLLGVVSHLPLEPVRKVLGCVEWFRVVRTAGGRSCCDSH